MPVAFLPHGGGPWPWVNLGIPKSEYDGLASYLRGVSKLTPEKPKALLVVSAHWEEDVPTVMTAKAPPMFYDYYGFPPESYRIEWPAPGEPKLAAKVRELIAGAGFETGEDSHRGYDHGTFVPLKVIYPEAEIPVVQLSLVAGLDASEHLKLGRALAPLRDEGVFILGSGNTFHNMRGFGNPAARDGAAKFDEWLRGAVSGTDSATRDQSLAEWEKAPFARFCHPREEHLIPLMVAAGAAGDDRAVTSWNGTFMGVLASGFHFG